MTPTLRSYQRAAVEAVKARYAPPHSERSTLLVLATGTGKTVIAAEIIRRTVDLGGRVLFLAHRSELLEQTISKLAAVGVTARLEKAGLRAGGADVVVASVQTLRGARLTAFATDAFRLVVVDECHRVMSAGYRAILDHFAGAYRLGLTATPDRTDGKALGDVFASCAYRYELRAAIRDGWLVPIVARRIELSSVDLSGVRVRAGDLAADQLAAVMGAEQALHQTAIPLLEQSTGRRTVAFCVDVAHAHALAAVLNRYEPGVARALDGGTDAEVRSDTLASYRRGEFRILVNVALFTEGWDEPSVSCIAMCCPTQSRIRYAQCIGRGSRLYPEKSTCLVLDFVGVTRRLGLVGPADVLAGHDLDEEVSAEISSRTAEAQLELDGLLDSVEADLAARREHERLTAVARYVAEEVDPFIGDMPAMGPSLGPPANAQQLAYLVKAGLPEMPDTLTATQANSIIAELERRKEFRLAPYHLVRWLKQRHVDARGMTEGDAWRRKKEILNWYDAKKSRRGAA